MGRRQIRYRKDMRFYIYQEEISGLWKWRLITNNGRIMAESGNFYVRRSGAVYSAKRLYQNLSALADCCAFVLLKDAPATPSGYKKAVEGTHSANLRVPVPKPLVDELMVMLTADQEEVS